MASTETFAQFDEYQQRSPEFQLWCAVLFRLIEDLQNGKNKATRYLWSEDFTWLCSLLGFDAVDVRQRLTAHTGISTKFKRRKKPNDATYHRDYMRQWRAQNPNYHRNRRARKNGVIDYAA